jgi:hypothetical protein
MKPDLLDEVLGCYPVKRRGDRRRLNPNRDGIAWLEEQSETDTEISTTYPMGAIAYTPEGEVYEFAVHRALGYYSARRRDMYPWPMFQVHAGFKASMLVFDSCPDCDDWSRTSRCTSHHDQDGVAGLKMGDERRAYRRAQQEQGTPSPTAYYSPSPPPDIDGRRFFDRAIQEAERVRQRLAARDRLSLAAHPCTCSMCTTGRSFTASGLAEFDIEDGSTVQVRLEGEWIAPA